MVLACEAFAFRIADLTCLQRWDLHLFYLEWQFFEAFTFGICRSRSITMGRWSEIIVVTVNQRVAGSRSACTMVISGELVVSPAILFGVWSLATPYFGSVIWLAISDRLWSAFKFECQGGWWQLNSPMISSTSWSRWCSMCVVNPIASGSGKAQKRYNTYYKTYTNLLRFTNKSSRHRRHFFPSSNQS